MCYKELVILIFLILYLSVFVVTIIKAPFVNINRLGLPKRFLEYRTIKNTENYKDKCSYYIDLNLLIQNYNYVKKQYEVSKIPLTKSMIDIERELNKLTEIEVYK